MPQARLHDGSTIIIEVYGQGPALLLPVNPQPVEGPLAEQMRQYGTDPALGQSLINGLSDLVRVVAFDFEGHVMRTPQPTTLTPDNAAHDLLAIADAAGAQHFAYYGYSWLAMLGLQLAMRTDRLSALVMGGFPPLAGPYKEMLTVTNATYEMTSGSRSSQAPEESEWSEVGLSLDQARQFLTLYQALQHFDDRAAQEHLRCPRLCFAGSADKIQYDQRWDNTLVDIASPIIHEQPYLENLGWDVRILDGLDHIQAMQPTHVIPILRPWLSCLKRGIA
ncbi:alpha/beta fold hydrolase [Dictyobacter aurantiacus]|uniref:Alpha/beta hydrolase n=1 Tax=Dictyobacter aurantiacus TaxID=1936993 RepID=A0A401ZKA5_9CHLR|nr:alpha/beta hydrolase [Dictyobacter aurantiacus]GCE07283.1 hypothetical protein KDAU_46120 [Dictyobacter aurantiacus]